MVVHIFDPGTPEADAGRSLDFCEFGANLAYKVRSRSARALYNKTVSIGGGYNPLNLCQDPLIGLSMKSEMQCL